MSHTNNYQFEFPHKPPLFPHKARDFRTSPCDFHTSPRYFRTSPLYFRTSPCYFRTGPCQSFKATCNEKQSSKMKIHRAKRKSCENNHATRRCTKQHQITTKQSRKTKMHETSPNYNKTIAHNENARNKTKLQQSSRTIRKYMKKTTKQPRQPLLYADQCKQ